MAVWQDSTTLATPATLLVPKECQHLSFSWPHQPHGEGSLLPGQQLIFLTPYPGYVAPLERTLQSRTIPLLFVHEFFFSMETPSFCFLRVMSMVSWHFQSLLLALHNVMTGILLVCHLFCRSYFQIHIYHSFSSLLIRNAIQAVFKLPFYCDAHKDCQCGYCVHGKHAYPLEQISTVIHVTVLFPICSHPFTIYLPSQH